MANKQVVDRITPIAVSPNDSHTRTRDKNLHLDLNSGIYNTAFNLTVFVAGLGYFVDTFDFFLYNGMRVVSLTELGLSGDSLTKVGIIILNCQIFGTLIGSFIWGILGDKIGRKKAMLGSIFTYSLGMIGNGLVHDPMSYAIIRFIIGFGIAGEVGLGAALVGETVKSSKRTYALMFFTVMGILGVAAAGAGIEFMSWRTCCFLGGGIGLMLLLLRSRLFESPIFIQARQLQVLQGSLKELFCDFQNFKRYILCIPLLGSNFLVIGILMTLAPEIAKATDTHGIAKANIALAVYFFAAIFGDGLGAWLSEVLKSRKIVVGIFILGNMSLAFIFLQKLNLDLLTFYFLCAAFGLFNMWAICTTILIEQFPTQLRATATTSNINFSRATVILMNLAFLSLKPSIGIINGLMMISAIAFALGLFCIWKLPESYGCSLVEAKFE